jgi:hypothetical protein
MANYHGIYSVGASIAEYLGATYPQSLRSRFPCDFRLVSSDELAHPENLLSGQTSLLSFYLYRITQNEHLRSARTSSSRRPLALDLHYLMTIWASTANAEQVIFAWALRKLHDSSVLGMSTLLPTGGWRDDEVVQITPMDLSTEDLMRIWDALQPPYHLTASYVARVVYVEEDEDEVELAPVIATRLDLLRDAEEE